MENIPEQLQDILIDKIKCNVVNDYENNFKEAGISHHLDKNEIKRIFDKCYSQFNSVEKIRDYVKGFYKTYRKLIKKCGRHIFESKKSQEFESRMKPAILLQYCYSLLLLEADKKMAASVSQTRRLDISPAIIDEFVSVLQKTSQGNKESL